MRQGPLDALVSDRLLAAGISWFESRKDGSTIYEVEVEKFEGFVLSGEAITVTYHEVIGNFVAIDLHEQELDIIEIRTRIDNEGVRVTGLTLTPGTWYPSDDPNLLADLARRLDLTLQSPSPIRSEYVIGGATAGASGASSNGFGGTVSEHDHAQFLLTSGARSLTGNLPVDSGVTIDGVDISEHAADPAAHHDPASVGSGLDIDGQHITLDESLTNDGYRAEPQTSDLIPAVSAIDRFLLWATANETLHDAAEFDDLRFLGRIAKRKIEKHLPDNHLFGWKIRNIGDILIEASDGTGHSTVLIRNDSDTYQADLDVERNIIVGGTVDGIDIAGHAADPEAHHPLASGGAGIAVQSGQIVVVDLANQSGLSFSSGLQIDDSIAGAGIIIAGKVLSIRTGDGLYLDGSDLAIELANPSGLEFDSNGKLRLANSVAGSGLTIANRVISVGAGLGIQVNANDVRLITPGSLSATSSNNAANNHTHNILTSSNPGAAESILATDSSGFLKLLKLYTDEITTRSGGDLDINADANLLLNPADEIHVFNDMLSDSYVSQTAGWQISQDGHADFRTMYADELTVEAFNAAVTQALAGAQIITKSVGKLSRNFTIPANGQTATLYVQDLEGFEDVPVFPDGLFIRLRYINMNGGGLVVKDVWGSVSGYSNLANGEQSWTWTTTDDGGVDGSVIFAGSVALDYGQSGDGVIESTVLDNAGSPYIQLKTWHTDPRMPENFAVRTRLGNLAGIGGADGFGLFAGDEQAGALVATTSGVCASHKPRYSRISTL